jgi:hypothetical protein
MIGIARLAFGLTVAALISSAHATVINLTPNGNPEGKWYAFDVDDQVSAGLEWIDAQSAPGYENDGSVLSFHFTLTQATEFRVVDGGYGGDEFNVSINGISYATSAAVDTDPNRVSTNFDAAWINPDYSKRSWILGPGDYTVTGSLTRSAVVSGIEVNATVSAVQLVPEPGTWGMLVAGLAAVAGIARRRLA